MSLLLVNWFRQREIHEMLWYIQQKNWICLTKHDNHAPSFLRNIVGCNIHISSWCKGDYLGQASHELIILRTSRLLWQPTDYTCIGTDYALFLGATLWLNPMSAISFPHFWNTSCVIVVSWSETKWSKWVALTLKHSPVGSLAGLVSEVTCFLKRKENDLC